MRIAKCVRVIAVTVSLVVVAAAVPAQAAEEVAPSVATSVTALSAQGDLVAETAAPESDLLAVPQDASEAIVLNPDSSSSLSIGLPNGADRKDAVDVAGLSVFRSNSDQTSAIVNPTDTGVQLVTVIGAESSPSAFSYPVEGPAGSTIVIDPSGAAFVLDAAGEKLAEIEAPWARDANGVEVPTRFVVSSSNTLTQVVDHVGGNYAYPITADPKVFSCDWHTHMCVKFTKSETKSISKSMVAAGTAYAMALALCSKIPHAVLGVLCVGVVTGYATALRKSFKAAAKNGKCIELHIPKTHVPTIIRWKTEGC